MVRAGFLEEVGVTGKGWEGKRTDVPGLRRGTKVEGVSKNRVTQGNRLSPSQMSVGAQDVSLAPSPLPALTLPSGCGGQGVWDAWAAFPSHYPLSLLSQDTSGAGPGESVGLGSSLVPSLSAVTLGAEPGPGHGVCHLAPGSQGVCCPPAPSPSHLHGHFPWELP